ncbi:Uncharacterised protein [Ectopseudomonas mendocina]|uniref:Uncharacterized protein n=1 Tax=Ectopseudomonas mendocina TaxID=300 RepID=A0A379PLE6_ECTME|nr:hypothetical protein [Pseudomonas mendocina]SUE95791.1 Uncharacterised protein [Pseudomonas mendocina]
MQVKITDPGFAGFTGHFGTVWFEDGVSEHISSAEAERLGCIVKCETLEGHNPSATQRMVDIQNQNLDELLAQGKGVVGADRTVEQSPEQIAGGQVEQVNQPVAKTEVTAVNPGSKPTFTREQLEELADKEGIAGLRNIGSQYGVKGRSIVEIIDELVALAGESQE